MIPSNYPCRFQLLYSEQSATLDRDHRNYYFSRQDLTVLHLNSAHQSTKQESKRWLTKIPMLITSFMTSSTGARRCDTWFSRLSISPSKPSSSYLSICRRNVLSHTPSNRAASSCVKRPFCQPPYAPSNLIFRVSCSHSDPPRVLWNRIFYLLPTRSAETACYSGKQMQTLITLMVRLFSKAGNYAAWSIILTIFLVYKAPLCTLPWSTFK